MLDKRNSIVLDFSIAATSLEVLFLSRAGRTGRAAPGCSLAARAHQLPAGYFGANAYKNHVVTEMLRSTTYGVICLLL